MAGHSEWANRKHRKKKQDRKRAKIFGKLSKKIISAARRGGGDPEKNTELRNIIERAKDKDMPKDNIERAILKGTGDLPGVEYEDVIYEGYGPGGVAIMVEVTTDNTNRSISQIRKIFDDHDGKVGERGCVSYQFDRKGYFTVPSGEIEELELFELAVEAGAEDVALEGDFYRVISSVEDFIDVKETLEEEEISIEISKITQIPRVTVPVKDQEAEKVIKLLEDLEEHDDVQQVHSNFEMDEDALKKTEAMTA
ncbi:MAG: YebC/PmpR family DNA-binding transcriptional regulator [bacterium]